MSWFSNLVETYDKCSELFAEVTEGDYLLPIGHMWAYTNVRITIDVNGCFLRAEKYESSIAIPCSLDSGGRSSNMSPHPLHDNLGYLAKDEEKFEKYMEQLEEWKGDNAKLNTVYKYIKGKTLIDDLENLDVETKKKLESKGDAFICFRVEVKGDQTPDLWKDRAISALWIDYYLNSQALAIKDICYITGELSQVAVKHPKGTNKKTHSAVLVSGTYANIRNNNSIGYVASQKGHAMLRYLIANQALKCDNQAIVAWTIGNDPNLPRPLEESQKYQLNIYDEQPKTGRDKEIEADGLLGKDYAKSVRNALLGMGDVGKLKKHKNKVAIIAVDAATTGRMSVTFYQELMEDEYLERIVEWHEKCCWYTWRDNISSPSADKIIEAIFGEVKGKSFDKIKKQALQRLLHNVFCNEPLNKSYVISATRSASNPLSCDDYKKWRKVVNVACALAKIYYSNKEGGFSLELETKRDDRDYLYGRLLAIAEAIEAHARYVQDKDRKDKNPTNAIRYMTAFASKPFRTWETIYKQLNPYIMRLNGAYWYQQQIDEIMSLFLPGEYEDNSSLNGKYLMGYSLQRRELYKQNKELEEDISNEPNQKD